MSEPQREAIYAYLNSPGWRFGWQSKPGADRWSFWHKHFAGSEKGDDDKQYECEAELAEKNHPMSSVWKSLEKSKLIGHRLVRCYANAFTYGCDGTLHRDSGEPDSFTSVYYPHKEWAPNWGGETVFFKDRDIVASIYPKPNRLTVFPGAFDHVARGVSRDCPQMRITLMFKTTDEPLVSAEIKDFLRAHTMRVPHSGRSLYEHLKGVYHLLKFRGFRDEVCLAGMFHSIYGTRYFKHAVMSRDERPVVRDLIGDEAELLAYTFGLLPEGAPRSEAIDAIFKANEDEQR